VRLRQIACVLAAVLLPALASGQASPYKAPRTPDGQPDLQGIWKAMNTAVWNIQDHSAEPGIPAGQGVVEGNELPYVPAALKQRMENRKNRLQDNEARCAMVGVPRITYMPYPFQIFQSKDQIIMVSEYAHTIRNIHLTGQHPPEGIAWYMGDSRAKWEGETLVVDVVHFTDQTWLDRSGNFHSPALRVVERYTRTGPDHMLYEATIEDKEVFSRPWKMRMTLYRDVEPNAQLLEYECAPFLEAAKNK
jgi:hypothetical protein